MIQRILMLLMAVVCPQLGHAITNEELLTNLSSRLRDLPGNRGTLIKSFTMHSQSYIYDQALAIIAFTNDNQKERAKKLLQALASLQMTDGSLYFSYFIDGTSPYPVEGDKRIAGSIAWVALAAIHYQNKFKSKEFVPFNYKILSYLETQMHPIEVKGTKTLALKFAPSDVMNTKFYENDVTALEHNLDAYAAFKHFQRVNKVTKWTETEKNLKNFILLMWDEKRNHFWSGANFSNNTINQEELYLDNQTWTLLALDETTLRGLSPESALRINCEEFLVHHNGVNGFVDSKSSRIPASHLFVWSEGTLGQVMAMKKLSKMQKKEVTCKDQSSTDLLQSVKKMKTTDRGIAYATKTSNKDFTDSSSAAGTAWFYFALNDFNPFDLEGLN